MESEALPIELRELPLTALSQALQRHEAKNTPKESRHE